MERLEIFSRKLAIPREIFMQIDTIKDRNGMDMDLTEAEDIKKTGTFFKAVSKGLKCVF